MASNAISGDKTIIAVGGSKLINIIKGCVIIIRV